jgi:hypothetical protein
MSTCDPKLLYQARRSPPSTAATLMTVGTDCRPSASMSQLPLPAAKTTAAPRPSRPSVSA